jgi:MFS family permease
MLALISTAVLLASSTWFCGTAAARQLVIEWKLDAGGAAWLTNATQYGFIAGTFAFALFNLADRFDARHVFCASALAGALFNLAFAWRTGDLAGALPLRFLTGISLAGVYPVAMKIVAGHFPDGLGSRLGVMVGCLTLGTALPYGIDALQLGLDWRLLSSIASGAAALGGLSMAALVREGPYLRQRARVDFRMAFAAFRHAPFRHSALGYFGHMWELYALWSLVGFWLGDRVATEPGWPERVPALAFLTVAVGAVGCFAGGFLSRLIGERDVALASLLVSGAFCAGSAFLFSLPPAWLLPGLVVWGFFVVSDSPQFSALAARHAPPGYTGTALTIQNGIGFLVTTLSIQLIPVLAEALTWRYAFVPLVAGPLLGAYFTRRLPR